MIPTKTCALMIRRSSRWTVTRTGTMAALVFAVGLLFGVALLVLGQFIPSRIVEPQSTTVQSEHVN